MAWPVSEETLAYLQDIDRAAMPSTCRRGRRTKQTSNGRVTYGATVAWAAPVPCRVKTSVMPKEAMLGAARTGYEIQANVALPLSTDVQNGDLIEATTSPGPLTHVQVWEVVAEPIRASYATSLRVEAVKYG